MRLRALLIGVALSMIFAHPAQAQGTGIEVGTSLADLVFQTKPTVTSVSVGPLGGFNLVNPAFYVSVPVTSHVAVEPRLGVLLVHFGGRSNHLLNLAGQVDYFFKSSAVSSPFVFGSVGVLHASGSDTTPTSISAGAGYRVLSAGRIAIRLDGNFTHFTNGGGNTVGFNVSLGGVFGRRK